VPTSSVCRGFPAAPNFRTASVRFGEAIGARRYREAVLWLVRTGKMLLFAAGLVAVLDVVGQRTVADWAKNAAGRRSRYRTLRESLDAVWPHLAAVARLAKRSVDGSDTDAATVRERVHTELVARRTPASLIDDIRYTYPVRERHAQQVIASRLNPADAEPLTTYLKEFRAFAARVRIGTGLASLAMIPVVMWVFWGSTVMVLIGWLELGVVIFAVGGLLMSPRVVLWVRWAGATTSHRLAATTQRMLHHEGRPLRAVALALFILGSLLDLIAGWD
jgi:hypothetical protein